jgi:hypothetical protein
MGNQMADDPHAPSPAPERGGKQSWSLAALAGGPLAAFVSQVGVITAILFYFGWARARATYGYFGLDVSVLDFSVSDYVLRSVTTVIPLIAVFGFVGIAGFIAHERLRPLLIRDDAKLALRLTSYVEGAAVILVAAGFAVALASSHGAGPAVLGPVVMLAGFTIGLYSLITRPSAQPRGWSRLVMVVSSMMVLTFLWVITSYADYVGIETAEQVQAGLSGAPNVSIYSSANLSLSGPGITLTVISGQDSEYHFRYSGLRLLIASGGQYFLLPSGWRAGSGTVIVLPVTSGSDSGNTRFEFAERQS